MKAKNIGNIILVVRDPGNWLNTKLLLGLKKPKDKADAKRKRKRVGIDKWTPPGGGTEEFDKNQKHAAQRELREETSLRFPLWAFKKVGTLEGFINDEPEWLVHLYLINTHGNCPRPVAGQGYDKIGWFKMTRLPFSRMLEGDRHWIPPIIQGNRARIKLFFIGDINDNKFDRCEVELYSRWC